MFDFLFLFVKQPELFRFNSNLRYVFLTKAKLKFFKFNEKVLHSEFEIHSFLKGC